MKKILSQQNGYIILVDTIFFIAITLIIVVGVINPLFSHNAAVKGLLASKQTYLVAHSAAEDAFYRIKTGKTLPPSTTLSLSSGSATITTTDNGGQKTITVNGQQNNYQRNLQLSIGTGAGIDFNYGLQAGNGGVTIGGGSTIIGNIYSNGTIHAVSTTITGTAAAADSAALTADQINDSPSTPTSNITFGDTTTASRDFAQSFQVSDTSPINKIQLYIKKASSAGNATVLIVADSAGSPHTSVIDSTTLSSGLVSSNYAWVDVVFPNAPSLIPGTTYWFVIQTGNQGATRSYTLGGNTAYANGVAKLGRQGTSWNATGLDGYFRMYTGGISSYIGGATYPSGLLVGNSATNIGDAWAGIVKGTTAYGTIYCTNIAASTNNNKSCNTTKGIPSPQPLPFSDANIQDWKDAAEAGGSQGGTTIGYAGGTLGPIKINGDLTVNGGGTLTLNGPIWVTGNFTVTGGGKVKLPSSYGKNSETIISDRIITINGGGSIGSGTSGSYLFMVSTSKCPDDTYCSGLSAININGGAGAVAANAQNGNVALSGGAAINAVVGNSITISGGSTVTYDAGLASPSFQSGPSGGYTLLDWLEN